MKFLWFKCTAYKVLVKLLLIFVLPVVSFAQTTAANQPLESSQVKITSAYNKDKLLVLPFSFFGMSESLSEAYAEELALNVAQIINFEVVTPKASREIFNNRENDLIGCKTTACGIMAARRLKFKYLLVSVIVLETDNRFNLSYKLLDVYQNNEILKGSTNFNKNEAGEEFLVIAQKIRDLLPMSGKVQEFDNEKVIVDIGSINGLKIGDRLAIYHSKKDADMLDIEKGLDLYNNPLQRTLEYDSTTNIDPLTAAVITVSQVTPNSALGTYLYSTGLIAIGDEVKTYLNKARQNEFIKEARIGIDQYHQFTKRTKKVKPPPRFSAELTNEEVLDSQKIEWIRKVRHYEYERDLYKWISLGSVASFTALLLFRIENPLVYVAYVGILGAGGYSTIKFLNARSHLSELINEGKFRGYLEPDWPKERSLPSWLQWLESSNNQNTPQFPQIVLFSFNQRF